MSTTNLFVELLVIGFGALTWFTLILLSIFGYGWVPVDRLFTAEAAVPILAFAYLLGILTDRTADLILNPLWRRLNKSRLKLQVMDAPDSFHRIRATVYTEWPELTSFLEYNRTRMRICRGWILNAFALMITLTVFLYSETIQDAPQDTLIWVGMTALAVILVGAFNSWWRLQRAYDDTLWEYFSLLESKKLLQD